MSAQILDGKALSQVVAEEISLDVPRLAIPPGLAVVLVGDDPASAIYVRNKGKMAEKLGFYHRQVTLPAHTTEAELLTVVAEQNQDPRIHGILVQLPLPKHIRSERVIEAIAPEKDVDGFHPINTGRLWQRQECLTPCTPAGVMRILGLTGLSFRGKEAVVVGRSNIVGKPMVALLERLDLTVTLAHSRTVDLAGHIARADVVVAAVGVPQLVKGAWIKPGAVVIDVGMNHLAGMGGGKGKLVGDVEFETAFERAGFITPVPGGVGPMTIAMLMHNTLTAARRAQS